MAIAGLWGIAASGASGAPAQADWKVIDSFHPPEVETVRAAFRLAENVALIGTEENGQIWRTEDGGLSWKKVADGLPTWNVTDVRYFYRLRSGTILATTSRGARILKSTDEGKTWTSPSRLPAARSMEIIEMDEAVLCGSRNTESGNLAVFRSVDQGETWTEIPLPVYEKEDFRQYSRSYNIEGFHLLPDGSVLAHGGVLGSYSGDGAAAIYRSTDKGLSWEIHTVFSGEVLVTDMVAHEGALFALFRGGSIYRSRDQGQNWSKQGTVPGAQHFGLLTSGGRPFLVVGGGASTIYRSTDGGETFAAWIPLGRSPSGRGNVRSQFAQINNDTFIAGTGNNVANAFVHTIRMLPAPE